MKVENFNFKKISYENFLKKIKEGIIEKLDIKKNISRKEKSMKTKYDLKIKIHDEKYHIKLYLNGRINQKKQFKLTKILRIKKNNGAKKSIIRETEKTKIIEKYYDYFKKIEEKTI